MYSNHPPSSSRRSPYEYSQGYDNSQQQQQQHQQHQQHLWPVTPTNHVPGQGKQPPTSYPPRFNSHDPDSHEDESKPFSNRSEYWFDHPTNPYSPPPNAHWPAPVYQQPQQRPPPHTHSPLQLPPTPSSTSSSTDISPHVDTSKSHQTGYPFPVTFQQQQQQQQQTSPTNHRTPHWRIPATERPFKCENCPLSFNRNHDLKRHARIHLSVKPFPCNFCDKRFSRKDALKRHMLVKRCGQAQAAAAQSKSSSSSSSGAHSTATSNRTSSYYDRPDGSLQTDTLNATNLFLPPPPVIQHRQSSSILHHHHHGLSNDTSSSATPSSYPI